MEWQTLVLFLLGFPVLILGAELLVRGAANLATAAGISQLAIGLTVIAYGTSAPEVAVSIQSTYAEPPQPDLAVGNVVGSNISNILLVLGIAGAIGALVVPRQLLRSTLPLMIGISFLLLFLGNDGQLSRIEGIGLVSGAVIYSVAAIQRSRREVRRLAALEEGSQAIAARPSLWKLAWYAVLILLGLGMLLVGAKWLVDGAVRLAELLGVSELVIGLTIVAIGTSLPEVATSVVAVLRGQRDIAVGNVVGSNIFNILLVLGICATVAPDGLAVSQQALKSDIPIMVAVAIACLPVFYTGYAISRWEGLMFLAFYAAYAFHLFLQQATGMGPSATETFTRMMVLFVIPVTFAWLLLGAGREMLRNRKNSLMAAADNDGN